MKKLSVILPTYNSDTYIEKTLNSIVNQTYSNLEVIVIDDASTDKTPLILENYAKNDRRIKLFFNKENIGPGVCRNEGIRHATGYYLTFMDHDDWQDLERYEVMIERMEIEETNICFASAKDYFEDTGEMTEIRHLRLSKSPASVREEEKERFFHFFPPWAKIYKTSFIRENKIVFAENGVKLDDVLFHSLLLSHIDKVSYENRVNYYHRNYKNSISCKHIEDRKYVNREYVEILKQALQIDPKNENLIRYYFYLIEWKRLSGKEVFFLFKVSRKLLIRKILNMSVLKNWN